MISEISTLNIGSRPASRKKTRKTKTRAIPWVFSWAECRLMLRGWYGFGTAVKTCIAEHPTDGIAVLKAMYREWPFFRTLLSNMDMVLSKSSIAIASRYAELVADVMLRRRSSKIRREHHESIETLLAVTDHRKLLEDNPLLDRSIRNRFPYLDPLNHIQIELLKQHRASGVNEQVLRGIQLTINGTSQGSAIVGDTKHTGAGALKAGTQSQLGTKIIRRKLIYVSRLGTRIIRRKLIYRRPAQTGQIRSNSLCDFPMPYGTSAQAKTRRSTVSPFVSKQRPWLRMIHSGRHESIFSTAALVFRLCKRSGNRIPKNSWPFG